MLMISLLLIFSQAHASTFEQALRNETIIYGNTVSETDALKTVHRLANAISNEDCEQRRLQLNGEYTESELIEVDMDTSEKMPEDAPAESQITSRRIQFCFAKRK